MNENRIIQEFQENNYREITEKEKEDILSGVDQPKIFFDYLNINQVIYLLKITEQLSNKILEYIKKIKNNETIEEKILYNIIKQICLGIKDIHNENIIHRDIKPDNFVMGLDDLSQFVYILDFGLAKKYRSSSTLIQYPMINKKKLTGTARYASINALKGYEQSRRDDLESLGYVIIYFLKGNLPWQGLKAKNKDDRYKKILQKKLNDFHMIYVMVFLMNLKDIYIY